GFYNMTDRARSWGKSGAFWGGLWGLLFSLWFFWIPGIGPLLVTIPIVIGAAALGTLSALAACVYSLGIPKDTILKYAAGAQDGRYVVMLRGTNDQIIRAHQVLDHSKSLSSMLNMPVSAVGV
ncbi:MAG TPA: permease, partial [Planctomycetota bacterium]|nr:permease [Planctomycetota bacterium]